LNELLGWGQLLSDATMCHHANADLNAPRPPIRCAFANCKRVPRKMRGKAEPFKSPPTWKGHTHCQCKERFGENLSWPNLTPELSRTAARNGGVVHVTMQPSREAVSA